MPSANAPASHSTPAATNQTRMWPARSRSIVPRSATTKVRNRCRPTWIATYEPAKSSARPSKASGIATASSEAAEHDREQQQPHRHGVRVELVRHPRRVVPGPPGDEQRERGVPGAVPAEVVEQDVRDLRDREHEDEVVEELEVGGPLLLSRLAAAQVAGHALERRRIARRCRPPLPATSRACAQRATGRSGWPVPAGGSTWMRCRDREHEIPAAGAADSATP